MFATDLGVSLTNSKLAKDIEQAVRQRSSVLVWVVVSARCADSFEPQARRYSKSGHSQQGPAIIGLAGPSCEQGAQPDTAAERRPAQAGRQLARVINILPDKSGVTVAYNRGGSSTATVLVMGPDGNAGTVPKLLVMALSAPTKT